MSAYAWIVVPIAVLYTPLPGLCAIATPSRMSKLPCKF